MERENWIYKEREDLAISQFKLAKLIGWPNVKLSNLENDKYSPTMDEVKLLKETFKSIKEQVNQGADFNKRTITGFTKKENPNQLQSTDWEEFKIKYPKSYLKKFTVENANKLSDSKSAPKGIAFFAGCGGMSLGFKAAGFNIVGHVEIEGSANKIYKENFPKAKLLGTDITKITDAEVHNWKKEFGKIDVLCGGPPCQGFSLAGKRNPDDYRNQLYADYLRIASILKPKAIVLENVRLMLSMKDKDGEFIVPKIKQAFSDIGYNCKIEVLNSHSFGVPQSRERVIFIGVRKDANIDISHPIPTHGLNDLSVKKALTFKDACQDLDALESGDWSNNDPLHWCIKHPPHVLKWLKATPEGFSAHDNKNPSLRPPSGFNTTYKRIKWDEPASTISTNFNMISGSRNVHPTSTRSYTIREAMRCQSFPDDFKVVGKWSDVRKAIGNAVPPLMAKAIADNIMAKLTAQ